MSPCTSLKPGQKSLVRDEYFKEVTTDKPNGNVLLGNFSRYKSTYGSGQDVNVKKGDYVVPQYSRNTMGKLTNLISSNEFL